MKTLGKVDKRRTRRSLKALSVANEVIDRMKNKKPINLHQIAVRNGYSVKSATAQKPYQTETFKEAVLPVLDLMKSVHLKAIENIVQRDFTKERLDSVVNVAKQMVHDTQLLQGKATEHVASQVVVYGSDDFLATQVKSEVK